MRLMKRVVCLLLVLLCLAGAAVIQRSVDEQRDAFAGQTYLGVGASDPQIVLLTHVLGGFKGLLVDAVWLRAVKLQQEQKFWELYQLYDWMGKLEPHLEKIWVFNGWNMAYNLVAELRNAEGRWQWVHRSIQYLRDEGLKHNPQSGPIMKEISWIFFHKIGKTSDLYHFYYKHRWALQMNAVMGDRDMQDMPGVAQAPRTLPELLADPQVAYALRKFKLDARTEPVSLLKEADGIYMIPSEIAAVLFEKRPEKMSFGEFLGTPDGAAARKVLNFVVARTLREKYKMHNLEIPVLLEKGYGKFDWRLPDPHAIYWGQMAGMADPDPKQSINYDRMIMFSLKESMQRGKITYMDPRPGGAFITTWDLSKIAPLDTIYRFMIEKYPDDWDHPGGGSVRDGHLLHLQEAIRLLYFAGYEREARKYFDEMRRLYQKPEPGMDMEPYVLGQVKKMIDEFGSYDGVRAWMDSCLYQMVFKYCINDFDGARSLETLTKRAWFAYAHYSKLQTESNEQRPQDAEDLPSEGGRDRAVTPQMGEVPGRIRHSGNLPAWQELFKETVRMIVSGQTDFPKGLIPILCERLKIKPEDVQTWVPAGEGLDIKIEGSSPVPK